MSNFSFAVRHIFSFDFHFLAVIVMSFYVSVPHFSYIGSLAADIWFLYPFSRWRPLWRNFTSGFRLADVTFFRRSVSI